MAIVQNPIIGRASKQAGGMVFSTVYGQNVMRSKPASYNDKASDAQVSQRNKLSLLTKFASLVSLYISLFLLKPFSGRSAYSQFIKLLSPFAEIVGSILKFNFANPLIYSGTVDATPLLNPAVSGDDLNIYQVDDMPVSLSGAGNKFRILVRNNTTGYCTYLNVNVAGGGDQIGTIAGDKFTIGDSVSIIAIAVNTANPALYSNLSGSTENVAADA
jgi:hypothetical protein